jgi:hypothetical protein
MTDSCNVWTIPNHFKYVDKEYIMSDKQDKGGIFLELMIVIIMSKIAHLSRVFQPEPQSVILYTQSQLAFQIAVISAIFVYSTSCNLNWDYESYTLIRAIYYDNRKHSYWNSLEQICQIYFTG